MGKQAKGTGNRNDGRPSGKASKKNPGRKAHGSKGVKLTEGQKIELGGGLLARYAAFDASEKRTMAGKRNKKD